MSGAQWPAGWSGGGRRRRWRTHGSGGGGGPSALTRHFATLSDSRPSSVHTPARSAPKGGRSTRLERRGRSGVHGGLWQL